MHIYKLQHMANIKTLSRRFYIETTLSLPKYCKRYFSMITVSILFCLIVCYLAHLSWKLKWAFLIDRLSSVVCLSICLSVYLFVCLSVRPSVNFSYFRLLKNHWANFNQTWHKASLGKRGYKGPFPILRGDNYEIAKNTLTKLKNLLLQNH